MRARYGRFREMPPVNAPLIPHLEESCAVKKAEGA
jgi:hypothetical protein